MKYEPMTLLIARDDEGKITTYGTGAFEGEDFLFFLGISKQGHCTLVNPSGSSKISIATALHAAATELLNEDVPKQTFTEED